MPECERCGAHLDPTGGGLRDALGLASYGGYECERCGALLCSDCYNKRMSELAGAAPDRCPQCDGKLAKR
jgi:DNA-directed RNA polymerase subunit RPC12/RpoP